MLKEMNKNSTLFADMTLERIQKLPDDTIIQFLDPYSRMVIPISVDVLTRSYNRIKSEYEEDSDVFKAVYHNTRMKLTPIWGNEKERKRFIQDLQKEKKSARETLMEMIMFQIDEYVLGIQRAFRVVMREELIEKYMEMGYEMEKSGSVSVSNKS
jgi:hypothetical protein